MTSARSVRAEGGKMAVFSVGERENGSKQPAITCCYPLVVDEPLAGRFSEAPHVDNSQKAVFLCQNQRLKRKSLFRPGTSYGGN